MEYEERKRIEELEAKQLELRKQELARQIGRDEAEDDRRDSSVANEKLFGVAMRASAICIRMGADPINAIPFFFATLISYFMFMVYLLRCKLFLFAYF